MNAISEITPNNTPLSTFLSTKSRWSSTNYFCFPTQPSCQLWQRRFALKGCVWTERVEIKGTKILSKKGYQPAHISPILTSSASYHPPPFILHNSVSSNFIIFDYFIFFPLSVLFENSAFREPPNSPNCSIFLPTIHHVFFHFCLFHAFRPICFHLWSCCRISKTRLSINKASMGCQRIRLV